MIIDFEMKDAKFVYSKDDFCYQEVLSDFINAEKIGIITFNISKKSNDILLDSLNNIDENCMVEIITNIPQRFESYYYDSTKLKTRGLINTYLSKLDPKTFEANVKVAFNFNNHMKVIATNNIAYIGSANFSVESTNNFEAGIISRDKEFIKYLFSEFFTQINNESTLYYPDEYNELRLSVSRLYTVVKSHLEYYEYQLFNYHEELDKLYFEPNESLYGVDDFNDLGFIDEEWDGLITLIENIDFEEYDIETEVDELLELHQSFDKQNISEAVDYSSSFYDFISLDFQSLFDNAFEEYSMEAYDEYLEGYIEKATDEANDKLGDAASECEVIAYNVRIELMQMLTMLEELAESIEELSKKVVNDEIDNTQ